MIDFSDPGETDRHETHDGIVWVLAWDIDRGNAYVSLVASDPGAPDWEAKGPFVTIMAAVRVAREAGIAVTHRVVVGDHDCNHPFIAL